MIIAGAGGLATQLFDDIVKSKMTNIVFWSEVETKYSFISDLYPMIRTDEEVKLHFEKYSNEFLLAIGGIASQARKNVGDRLRNLGGTIFTYISATSEVSSFGTQIGAGSIILSRAIIEPAAIIGKECLINKYSVVGHGCVIGDYSDICGAVLVCGEAEVGSGTFIGTGTIIYPKIKLGKNVMVSAGSVVTKNVPDNCLVAGVPAVIKSIRKNVG